jgi:small-conductance mechanosensitive channel
VSNPFRTMSMSEFFNLTLFTFLDENVTISDLLFFLIVFLAAFLLNWGKKHLIKKRWLSGNMYDELGKKINNALSIFIWILALGIGLQLIGVPFKTLMKYSIFTINKISFTPKHLLVLIIIFLVTRFIILGIKCIFETKISSQKLDLGISASMFQIIKYAVWILAIGIALESVGIKITLLLAGAGALLIGMGFGIQHIFNDIVSGFVLLIERNIKVDDIVEVEGIIGKVEDIGFRSTRVLILNNIEILLPNSKFVNENVINWSHSEKETRFFVEVGVAYGSDVRLVEESLYETAVNHPKILNHPKPFVIFKNYGDSSLDFELYFYTNESFSFLQIKSDLRFATI